MLEIFERHVKNIKEKKDGEYMGCCPFHDDRRPSFSFTEEGLFYCHGCQIKGHANDFAKMVGEEPQKWVKKALSLPKVKVWSPPLPLDKQYNDIVTSAQDVLLSSYDKLVGDLPWHKSIVTKLMIGWDNGFVFPYLNPDGKLVNIKWHKRKQVTGHATTFIFPYWHMVHKYKTDKILYVTEGEKDVVSLISGGKQAITLNNGCNSRWPRQLIKDIANRFDEVCPYFDNDEPGQEASFKFIEEFSRYAIS